MKVFVSYSRHDERAVSSLVSDLQRANVQVWIDEELSGGDAWWTEILARIRDCTVFLFALSERSLYSKPCRAELSYARDLGLPILPVQIGEVSSYRADPIFSTQLIDYRTSTGAAGFALMGALNRHVNDRVELPDPLPPAPPIPYEYLQRLGAQIHDSAILAPAMQAQMLFELRNALREEYDQTARADIRGQLAKLRRRSDVTVPIAAEIDTILAEKTSDTASADASAPASTSETESSRQERGHRQHTGPLLVGIIALVAVAAIAVYLLQVHTRASQAPATQSGGISAPAAQPAPLSGPTAQPSSAPGGLNFAGLNNPGGVAVDSAGNVYVGDVGNGRVMELAAGSSSATPLAFTGLGKPGGVAVDAARTVYVSDVANRRVLKVQVGSSSPIELQAGGLTSPDAIAVDRVDNLYIIDGSARVLKLAAGSNSTMPLPFTGLSSASGVAVDSKDAVYVTDGGNNQVLRLAADTNSATPLPFTGLNNPKGIAVDGAGNVYVTDTGNNRVLKLAGGSDTPTELEFTGLSRPEAVAVGDGSVYVADTGNNRVVSLAAG
jgi:sugar lactone lactonase YvrE